MLWIREPDNARDRDADAPLSIASVSKPITAIAIFQLIEQDRLRLTDKVFGAGAVLGTSYGTLPYGPHIGSITVRHLLEHTSGGWPNDNNDPMFLQISLNHHDLISWTLDKVPLLFAPGTQYLYSNFGYCLLGRIIEAISGLSYAYYVQQFILAPCGAPGLAIAGNSASDRQSDEAMYVGENLNAPYHLPVRRMDSHGGWIGIAERFASYLAQGGRLCRPGGHPQRGNGRRHDDAVRSESRLRERLGGQLQRHAVAQRNTRGNAIDHGARRQPT